MCQNEETLPIVDMEGRCIGESPRSVCHDGCSMLLHPVVHLHVLDMTGRLLLQRRSIHKKIQPGKWDTAVGGHVSIGESIYEALVREVREEIGLELTHEPELLNVYQFSSAVEKELVYCHIYRCDFAFNPVISEPDDIDELRFWSIDELCRGVETDIFTPNFKQEFLRIVLPYIKTNLQYGIK